MNRKVAILLLGFFLLNAGKFYSQSSTIGIYKTAADYSNSRLLVEINPASPHDKIRLHHIFGSRYVDIDINGEKKRFLKDSVWGYRDNRNTTYRFYKNNAAEYRVMESKGIVIYTMPIPDVYSTSKGTKFIEGWFFSKTAGSEIMPLTIANLKKPFRDNLKFYELLTSEFATDSQLQAYDAQHSMYRINFLLTQTSQNENP